MTDVVLIVENLSDWKPHFPDYPVASAREYLIDSKWSERKNLHLINLCRSQRYQSVGYYCSLLAEARAHKIIPNVRTIQDLSRKSIYSLDTSDLDQDVDKVMNKRQPDDKSAFKLNVYFGHCDLPEFSAIARELFEIFPAPILQVEFRFNVRWRLYGLRPISLSNISDEQLPCFLEALQKQVSSRWRRYRNASPPRYDLAILYNPEEAMPPSDKRALQLFEKAAKKFGINAELIEPKEFGKLAEYDGLFIRETTRIDHHTYRFARKAAKEGMVVIDDPVSILRCTNKIYLAELLRANKIGVPKTVIIDRNRLDELEREIHYPIVMKIPDGSFSIGIHKVKNRTELEKVSAEMFKHSELILAQEFTYTEFDWRVGILNRKPIYVCEYHMSKDHWQIYDHSVKGKARSGGYKTLRVEDAPQEVVKTALRAANLIGDGLYGVDLKQTDKGVMVIEVNDNPSIESGVEDAILKDELYQIIMAEFFRRLEAKRAGGESRQKSSGKSSDENAAQLAS
jgi:glutathione synthase/RimK-type ligase-like ATP-grasp enzyme